MVCKCVNIRVQLVIVWRNRGYAWLMVMLVPLRMLVYISWHGGKKHWCGQNQSESLCCIVSSDPLTWTWFHCIVIVSLFYNDDGGGDLPDPTKTCAIVSMCGGKKQGLLDDHIGFLVQHKTHATVFLAYYRACYSNMQCYPLHSLQHDPYNAKLH